MDLKAWADSQLFIVLCYCFSFGPWGILFGIDFITPKWRTIHVTRISGWIHLFFSAIPLPVAVFYLIVQRAAGDFKEMMASCIAAIVALYNIFRSISGLAQLRAYSTWCAKAVYCLEKLKSIDKVRRDPWRERRDWRIQRFSKFGRTHDSVACSHTNCPNSSLPTSSSNPNVHLTASGTASVPANPSNIDTEMRVNNQVIDNELFGSDLAVRLRFPKCGILKGLWNVLHLRFDDWFCSMDTFRCSLRWTIAVLSHYGRHWVHCNKPESFPETKVELYLPYQKVMPEDFHRVLRAYENTLATDALFYNGGVLDDIDIYLKDKKSEIILSKKHMESLRNLDIKQVLYFLALMARDGETTDIPMEPVDPTLN